MREQPVAEPIVHDSVLAGLELPLRRTFYPLGFPLELTTNSADIIEAACGGWGLFTQTFDEPPVRLSLGVFPGQDIEPGRQSTFRTREHLLTCVANPDNFIVCDLREWFAFGWVTGPVAANHPLLRYRFLTAGGLTLIEQRWLAPMHCALIARGGCGIALCGDSFAGKSTLAYACARAGWTYVCDDGAELVRSRADRYAVGDPYTLHLREDAAGLFPELSDRLAVARPNGKIGIEVLTRELPVAIAPGASIEHLVFLNRNEPGPARLRPYPAGDLLAECESHVLFGTRDVRESQIRCYRRLLGAGLWEMCYRDLDDAIVCLEKLVASETRAMATEPGA